jgi:hypothetical protein
MADITPTPASCIGSASATRRREYNFGFASATAAMVVYLDSSNLWQKVDSNAAVTGNEITALVGMTENGGGIGQPAVVVTYDTDFTPSGTLVNGSTVYTSTNAGAYTHDVPTTGAFPRSLGIAKSTSKMVFNPTASGVVI